MIKSLLPVPLAYLLINYSFSCETVRDKLNLARVVPTYKKGPAFDVLNYRPISLPLIFNRTLEKLMYKRLIDFLEKNKVLFHGQFVISWTISTNRARL